MPGIGQRALCAYRRWRIASTSRSLIAAASVCAALAATGCRDHARDDGGAHIAWDLKVPLSEDEKRYLHTLPTLSVGFDAQWPPMAFADRDGRLDGISSDYLEFVRQTLGIRLRVVPTPTWAEAIARANRGELDIVVAASKHDALKPGFALSTPYVRYPLVIVTRESAPFISGPADLAGTTVALVENSDIGRMIFRDIPGTRSLRVPSAQDGLNAVEEGRAFAYIGNLGVVDRLVRERHAGNLRVAAPVGAEQELSFAIAPQYDRLASLIDRTLAAIPPEEHEHIQNSWLSTRLTFGVPTRTLWLVLTPAASLTAVFVLVLSFNLRRLRREVRQRCWTEQALRFETQFKTNLMNTVPIPVFVKNMDGTYLAVNPAYEAAMGVRADRVAGRQMHAIGHVSGDDLETLGGITARVIDTGRPAHGEVRYRGPDGQMHDAIYWVRACLDENEQPCAVLGAFVDVSELRRMERRELELKRQLVELTEALPAVVFQIRCSHRPARKFELVFVNEQAYAWLRMHRGARTDPFAVFLHCLSGAGRFRLARCFLRSARTLEPFRSDFELTHGTHRSAWVHLEAAPQVEADGVIVWSGSVNDVTEARANEAALVVAKKDAQAATRARDVFLATVSHEIRTPMSGVIGILQLLDHGGLSADDQHLVDMARNAAQILLRILNDVLDFARSEHHVLPLEQAPFSVADTIERCAGIMAPEFARRQLRFDVAIMPDLHGRFIGDGQRLGQVLLNLLGNAAKFTEHGGVSIHASATPVEAGQRRIVVRVADTGVGIASEDQARLFSPFAQASGNSPSRHGGTGLGLAICKRIVESMQGEIALESSPGKGTVVEVSVLLRVDDETTGTGQAASPVRPARLPDAAGIVLAASPRVLIVEDNDINREVLERQLERIGVTHCEVARNGREALSLIAQHPFDLVITDFSMPEMNGLALVGEIRARERDQQGQRTAVVVLTANAVAHQTQACIEAGADAVCVKPLTLAELGGLFERHGLAAVTAVTAVPRGQPSAPVETHADLLERVRETLSEDMRALDARVQSGDREAARAIAHRMSGCASWFQLEAVAAAARATECALDAGDPFDTALTALRNAVIQT